MPDKYIRVLYTPRAYRNSEGIKNYILHFFTQKEVDNFFRLLDDFEKIVSVFPELYRIINQEKKVHKAVLSKQLSVFYKVKNGQVNVVAIIDNRMDYSRWP